MNNRKATLTIRNLMFISGLVLVQEPKNRVFISIDLIRVCIGKIKYSLSCSDSFTRKKTTHYHRN